MFACSKTIASVTYALTNCHTVIGAETNVALNGGTYTITAGSITAKTLDKGGCKDIDRLEVRSGIDANCNGKIEGTPLDGEVDGEELVDEALPQAGGLAVFGGITFSGNEGDKVITYVRVWVEDEPVPIVNRKIVKVLTNAG